MKRSIAMCGVLVRGSRQGVDTESYEGDALGNAWRR